MILESIAPLGEESTFIEPHKTSGFLPGDVVKLQLTLPYV